MFLGSGITVFAQLFLSRVSVSFDRMLSRAYGGATDLSPASLEEHSETDEAPTGASKEPAWETFAKTLSTYRILLAGISALLSCITAATGVYALANLLKEQNGRPDLWAVLGIMVLQSFIRTTFSYFNVAVMTTGRVAMANRRSLAVSSCSIVLGGVSILLGGSLLTLVIVQFLVAIFGILWTRIQYTQIVPERWRNELRYRISPQILEWARGPIWKGSISVLSVGGVRRFAGVLITPFFTAKELAPFLLAQNLLLAVEQFAIVPFRSQLPRMCSMMGSGRINQLTRLIKNRVSACLFIHILCCLLILVGAPVYLSIADSSIGFVSPEVWVWMAGLALVVRLQTIQLAVLSIGNIVVDHWRQLLAGVSALSLLVIFRSEVQFRQYVMLIFLPGIFVMNVMPFKRAAEFQGMSLSMYFKESLAKDVGIVFTGLLLLSVVGRYLDQIAGFLEEAF